MIHAEFILLSFTCFVIISILIICLDYFISFYCVFGENCVVFFDFISDANILTAMSRF